MGAQGSSAANGGGGAGQQITAAVPLPANTILLHVCGEETLSFSHPIWSQLFGCNINGRKTVRAGIRAAQHNSHQHHQHHHQGNEEQEEEDEGEDEILDDISTAFGRTEEEYQRYAKNWSLCLAKNNAATQNLHTLIAHVALRLASFSSASSPSLIATSSNNNNQHHHLFNNKSNKSDDNEQLALNVKITAKLIRILSKSCVENIPLDDLFLLYGGEEEVEFPKEEIGHNNLLDGLLSALITTAALRPTPANREIVAESACTLLLLLSADMFCVTPLVRYSFVERTMKFESLALRLVMSLLRNFMEDVLSSSEVDQEASSSSLLRSIGAAATSVAALPSTLSLVLQSTDSSHGIGDLSLLLLMLLLSSHRVSAARQPLEMAGIGSNPFLDVIASLQDMAEYSESPPTSPSPGAVVSYSDWFECLCSCVREERGTLLFYLAIHHNRQFRTYISARTDIDALIVPMLRVLYEGGGKQQDQMYLLLITLLILSQDVAFCKSIFSTAANADFVKDKVVTDVSVGSLLLIVISRSVHTHFSADACVQMNRLGILANVSPFIADIHPLAAQRLVILVELLHKRIRGLSKPSASHDTKVSNGAAAAASEDKFSTPPPPPPKNSQQSDGTPQQTPDIAVERSQEARSAALKTCKEYLKIILDAINAAFCNGLARNPHLAYQVLLRKELFASLKSQPYFSESLHNIETIVKFFGERIAKEAGSNPSPTHIHQVISHSAPYCPALKHVSGSEIKFSYEETDNSEDYFRPYIWNLVYEFEGIHWLRPRG